MNITSVSIAKLFGIFNHEIPFNQESGVTIVIGENGIGKTKILEAVNAVFNNDYNFLSELDFEKLTIHFDNKESWEFSKALSDEDSALYVYRRSTNAKFKPEKFFSYGRKTGYDNRNLRAIEIQLEHLRNEMIHSHRMYEARDLERLMIERHYMERNLGRNREKTMPPKWLIDESNKINVRLIETQRIITRNESAKDSYRSMVTQCSNELKDLISNAIKSSADITSALDSTYPNRLVKNLREKTDYTYAQLNEELSDLNEKRKYLSAAGLVVDAQDSELAVIQDEHNDLIVISMKQYVEDSKLKLEPYENLAKKISLFMSILSNRFKHKRLKVSKEDGLEFSSIINDKRDKPIGIDLTKLSSGEQHELVLFYKLIFNSTPGDLILIDEPELSLHISWQNQFIDDLKRVAEINKFTAVIATHSPDIISSNWDLRVELEGIE
ncbi:MULTISPECIES: AAA family ATPase [unclassified Pseudomonas]|uniref:AAA family ATPase n=1 Tax=unclassified Pseudomonas TaxID=196821 RepID=UPI000D903CC7|nr:MULTISPECIES: AAA family ATPase [unclassified Pseudomonas]PYG83196.1 putative ATP-binding protein involved in virulence [Pseudomonas sp. RV120224-01c]PYG86392.1 putative ATP-binding protein involved in virulence [Pseudomonas sp. RV120224-01b]